MNLGRALWLFSPELILLLLCGVLLGLDVLRRFWDTRRWPPYAALAGLTGAFVAAATQWDADLGIAFALSSDRFALLVKLTTLAAMALVVLLSSVAVQPRHGPYHGRFYALLLLAALAIGLLSAAADLLMVVLALELFGVVSYVLAGALRGGPQAGEAAMKAFLYGAVGSALILYGLSFFYGVAGTTDLGAIATTLGEAEAASRPIVLPAVVLVVVGFAFKVAAVPFHQWAPDSCQGVPAPAAALFAVGPALAGFAGLARVLLTALPASLQALDLDLGVLLSALAAFTMVLGYLFALQQRDIRRFLAYLGTAQVGYLLVGLVACLGVAPAGRTPAEIAAISQQGVAAALYALVAYVLSSLGALAAAHALSRHTGSFEIEHYAGMHRQSPELAWPLLVCLLSLAGLPPAAGFLGRLYLFSAGVRAGLLWLVVAGALGGVVSLACVWKVVRVLFVAPPPTEDRPAIPAALAIVLGAAVAGLLAAMLLADPLLALFQAAAQALVG